MTGRRALALGGCVALTLAGVLAVSRAVRESGRGVPVERGDLVVDVEVSGTLRAVESSALGPPQVEDMWQFKIAMMVDEGTEVTTGQPVLAFDATELQQRLQTKQADLDAATTEVEKKRLALEVTTANDTLALAEVEARYRKAELIVAQPQQLHAGIEVQKAKLNLELAGLESDLIRRRIDATRRAGEAELEVLEADLARVESEIRQIGDAIGRMVRTAPRDGLIIHTTNWRNEKKKVGDGCSVMDQVLEIPDLSRMEADGEVEEALAGKVREGQQVTIRLDAYPDREYKGTVSSISKAVQEKSWSNPLKIVRMTLALAETDAERMRPGMRFRGDIEIARHPDVTLVPIRAVQREGDALLAYRRSFGRWRRTVLTLGDHDAELAEVVHGLEPGDLVLEAVGR